MMKEKIVCKNLKKVVGSRTILDGVNFAASKGSVTALLGPNGAGKTTIFSLLCGLIKPDSGSIFLDEINVTDLPMYKRARLGLGYLPQEASIFRGLTVEENIFAVLEIKEISVEKKKALLEKLLTDLSLTDVRKSSAVSVSGGERRKLEIARALATDPSFILLDEPFSGIDPLAIEDMKNMIFDLKKRGIGVIITDHNVRETIPLADYAYILFEGRILTEGTPDEIINHDIARKIYLGESFSGYTLQHDRDG
jgi:lipopolysaccharide export system ATP-binding protein